MVTAGQATLFISLTRCLWHGCQLSSCPIVLGRKINPVNLKPMSLFYFNTMMKEQYFKSHGFYVVSIFESGMNIKATLHYARDFYYNILHVSW